jgi:hypothetical protein
MALSLVACNDSTQSPTDEVEVVEVTDSTIVDSIAVEEVLDSTISE